MRFRLLARSPWLVPAALAAGFALSGCGSSGGSNTTGPGVIAAHAEAEHLDTLSIAAAAAHYTDRNRLLTYPIAVYGEGVTPASVSVSVDGTAEPYSGAVLEIVQTTAGASPTPSDSTFYLFAWSDSDVTEMVWTAVVLPGDTIYDWAELTDSVANFNYSSLSVSITPGSVSGGCSALTTLFSANDLLVGTTCKQGKASASFDYTYVADPPTNPHSTFTMAATQVPLVRIVLPAGDGGTDRLARLLGTRGRRLLSR